MSNWLYGAARRYAKQHGVAFSSSSSFRELVFAISALDPSDTYRDDLAAEEVHRLIQARAGIRLQRTLELDHRLPHCRSLLLATKDAVSRGIIRASCVDTALGANLSRHKRWSREKKWVPKVPTPSSTDASPPVGELANVPSNAEPVSSIEQGITGFMTTSVKFAVSAEVASVCSPSPPCSVPVTDEVREFWHGHGLVP